ncbi:MAG: alpha/beta fold hydrolase [Isosphaeraceae bacterium]|nr:alpha/beta fold hydrolase [Isosphaeraceae bacterium]
MSDSPFLVTFVSMVALAAAVLATFLLYVVVRYSPIIGRIFEEKPLFLPLRLQPPAVREDVRFQTADGLELAGSYLHARTSHRIGVIVFCHEYLGDRWSYQAYTEPLRDAGFDVFAFDFRNHGASASEPSYRPLQWVTDHEVRDLEGALSYLRSRVDHDPAGFGLFGVSRGGSAALAATAHTQDVWGVITDGAFPTHGTMFAYILRWAEIYVGNEVLWKHMPHWVFHFLATSGRLRSEKRLRCRFPNIEAAVPAIAPRPWLMIHGGKDAYIGPAIAERLFALARQPKEKWIVPGAKHNRCREVQPAAYAERIAAFLGKYAPRRPLGAEATEKTAEGARWSLPTSGGNAEMGLGLKAEMPVAGKLAEPVRG